MEPSFQDTRFEDDVTRHRFHIAASLCVLLSIGGIIAPAVHLAAHTPEAETRSECSGELHISSDRHHGQAVICWLCEAVPVGTLADQPEVPRPFSYDEAPVTEPVSTFTSPLPGNPSTRAPPVA